MHVTARDGAAGEWAEDVDAVVLAGGSGRRLGGADKPALDFGGRSCLDRVLDALAQVRHVVVVGPRREIGQHVTWVREDPPGAGPVAALRTGLAATRARLVVVLAADLPLLDSATVARVVRAAAGSDGAALVVEGRAQFLLAAYDRERLGAGLRSLDGSAPLRLAVAGLDLTLVDDDRGVGADCDTWDDVDRLRRRL